MSHANGAKKVPEFGSAHGICSERWLTGSEKRCTMRVCQWGYGRPLICVEGNPKRPNTQMRKYGAEAQACLPAVTCHDFFFRVHIEKHRRLQGLEEQR